MSNSKIFPNTVVIHVKHGDSTSPVIIDEEDKVYFDMNPVWITDQGYVHIMYQGRSRRWSHVVLKIVELPAKSCVDHKNRDRLNNSKSNLRVVSYFENNQNRGKKENCTSAYIGVSLQTRDDRWYVAATFHGQLQWLGSFPKDQEIEAGKMYDKFIIFKYQSLEMSTNGLLTSEEIEQAMKTDPTPVSKKSIFGTNIIKSGNSFQFSWIEHHKRTRKSFKTLHEANVFKIKKLSEIKNRARVAIFEKGITYNTNGIPIIITNKTRGVKHEIMVNENIYFKLAKYDWTFKSPSGLVTSNTFGKYVVLPELVLKLFGFKKSDKDTSVDHCHQNHNDCRIQSLRYATKSEQIQNKKKRKNTTNKHVGVYAQKSGKWTATINFQWQTVYSETFESEEKAKAARDIELIKYYTPILTAEDEYVEDKKYEHHLSDESSEDEAIERYNQNKGSSLNLQDLIGSD